MIRLRYVYIGFTLCFKYYVTSYVFSKCFCNFVSGRCPNLSLTFKDPVPPVLMDEIGTSNG